MTARSFALPVHGRQDEGFGLIHRYLIPSKVHLDGDALCYGEFEASSARRVINPGIKLLTEFLSLANASAPEIERYAKRRGVLALCQHSAGDWPLVAGHERYLGLDNEPCRLLRAEPLELWRRYAGLFGALRDRGTTLREGRRLRLSSRREDKELDLFLGDCDWLVCYVGCLRPVLVVESCKFEVKFGGGSLVTGLSAALVTQLLFTVAGAAEIGTCASCGRSFSLRRRPRAGENSYCPECGIRAAWRDAQRRRRKQAQTANK